MNGVDTKGDKTKPKATEKLHRPGVKAWINFRGKIPGIPVGAWIPQIRGSKYNAPFAAILLFSGWHICTTAV